MLIKYHEPWPRCGACGTLRPPAALKDGACTDIAWCRRQKAQSDREWVHEWLQSRGINT